MPILNEAQLAEISAREQAASKGPWDFEHAGDKSAETANVEITDPEGKKICDTLNADDQLIDSEDDGDEYGSWRTYFENGQRLKDMRFIAHARVDVPALIDTVRELLKDKGRLDWLTIAVAEDRADLRNFGRSDESLRESIDDAMRESEAKP